MKLSDLAYKMEGRFARGANRALRLRPTSSPFVSGDGFRSFAHHRLERGVGFAGSRVAAGDVIFVETHELPRFRSEVLPGIRHPFVLISHNSDSNTDESFLDIAEDERLIRWFAQNCLVRHDKVQAIPIGLENRWLHNNGIVADFHRLRRHARERRMRILYAFSVGTNELERRPALAALSGSDLAEGPVWKDSRTYRRCMAGYAFVASPPGHGFDCHRTWEALCLGVVPIVKRSPFFEAFPGLPVVAIESWSEVAGWDEAYLAETYQALSLRLDSTEYLQLRYWRDRIAEAAALGQARRGPKRSMRGSR